MVRCTEVGLRYYPSMRTDQSSAATEAPKRTASLGSKIADRVPHVNDFVHLDDEAFIEAAYRVALHRGPDPEGRGFYQGLLEQGASKAEILGHLGPVNTT